MANAARFILQGAACLLLAACGGGGGDSGTNVPPKAVISALPACGQVSVPISFSASGSTDPDGSISTHAWNFGDNSSATGAQVTHSFASSGTFRVTLTVTDNRGAQGTAAIDVTTIAEPVPSSVMVSGTISFERVPFAVSPADGLDYANTAEVPAREVEVELLRAADRSLLQTTVTNAAGQFRMQAPANTDVWVRAKASTRPHVPLPGGASWNARVLDNTSSNALYVLDGSAFNTCVVDHTRNLKATTGWGGAFAGIYTGVRAAAPFAVLDTIYSAVQFVIAEGDGGVQLPALNAYWSESNLPLDGDFTRGQIGTTRYFPPGTAGIAPGIYVLGAAGHDTDEFDQHVIAHEFLHYLEDAVSRADTVGGPHSLDERLDLRVAFSEGYANAFSAMALNDPIHRDSFGTAQGDDFNFSVESRATPAPGWYNETSVHRIVWDLFDTVSDGADAVSIGYGPLHDVFVAELRDGVPVTSMFPFIAALKQRPGVPAAQVDALVGAERVAGTRFGIVATGLDEYATTETFDGGSDASLPVYADIAIDGRQTVCADAELGAYNALGNRRLLRFSLPVAQSLTIRAECVATASSECTAAPSPDPGLVLRRASAEWVASDTGTIETLGPLALQAGEYVIEAYEYSHVDLADVTRRGRTCILITLTSR